MDRQRYRLSSDRYDWEAVRRLNDQSAIRNSDNPLVAALVIVFVRALLSWLQERCAPRRH